MNDQVLTTIHLRVPRWAVAPAIGYVAMFYPGVNLIVSTSGEWGGEHWGEPTVLAVYCGAVLLSDQVQRMQACPLIESDLTYAMLTPHVADRYRRALPPDYLCTIRDGLSSFGTFLIRGAELDNNYAAAARMLHYSEPGNGVHIPLPDVICVQRNPFDGTVRTAEIRY